MSDVTFSWRFKTLYAASIGLLLFVLLADLWPPKTDVWILLLTIITLTIFLIGPVRWLLRDMLDFYHFNIIKYIGVTILFISITVLALLGPRWIETRRMIYTEALIFGSIIGYVAVMLVEYVKDSNGVSRQSV